jgi:hypothetical protein
VLVDVAMEPFAPLAALPPYVPFTLYAVNVTVNCPPDVLLYVFVGLRVVLVVPSPKFQR